jgi:hypothetical protein
MGNQATNLIQSITNPTKNTPEVKAYVIGFGHRARSGKDTAAAFIVQERGEEYGVKSYSFARALKEEVTAAALNAGGMRNLWNPSMWFYQENGNLIQLPDWVVFEEDAPVDDLCPLGKQRTLLQWWGTEFRRSVNTNYWVDRLAETIAKENPRVALITDMRFPNEMDFVKQCGGDMVRVDRPSLPPLNGAAGAHPSELALANVPDWEWTAILKNDGTLEEFKVKTLKLFDTLFSLQGAGAIFT